MTLHEYTILIDKQYKIHFLLSGMFIKKDVLDYLTGSDTIVAPYMSRLFD